MNKIALRGILAASLIVPLALPLAARAAGAAAQSAAKTLQGKVMNSSDQPLSGAIVYLQDGRTNSIRSFISTANGSYNFGQLSPDTDYQVWARYKSFKSDTKGISSYDSRHKIVINFRIKTK